MQILEQVPDSVKLTAAAASPVLTFLGIPLQEWVYIASLVMTILFIIEKIPKALISLKWMYRKIVHNEDAPVK